MTGMTPRIASLIAGLIDADDEEVGTRSFLARIDQINAELEALEGSPE